MKDTEVISRYRLIQTIAIAIIAAIVSLVVSGCSETQQSITIVNATNQTPYISTNLEQCKMIRYGCFVGNEPFTDEKGCGCRPIAPASQSAMNTSAETNQSGPDSETQDTGSNPI